MCLVSDESNFRLLATISNLTALTYDFLRSVQVNNTVIIDEKGWTLNKLYTGHVIDFSQFSSNSIIFKFTNFFIIHKRIILRSHVYTTCLSSQNRMLTFTSL